MLLKLFEQELVQIMKYRFFLNILYKDIKIFETRILQEHICISIQETGNHRMFVERFF